MPIVTASPNEYLVAGRDGKTVNYGTAISTFLWPGTTYVIIPSTQQEATFEMTQESLDGIPLRFKGIVVYRISAPEIAARRFNFTRRIKGVDGRLQSFVSGLDEIRNLLSHVCLGELRATVSHLTMKDCIEQRKTTLTDSVRNALVDVVKGTGAEDGWGVDIDVVQVAQVFIVDNELRRQLEAGVRNQIKSTSDLSDLHTQEEIKLARAVSERRMQQEELQNERQRSAIALETLQIKKDLELKELEAEIRTQEEVKLTEAASQRRIQKEKLENEKQRITIAQETSQLQKNLERAEQENEIRKQEEIKLARMASERRLEQENLESEKQRVAIADETVKLQKALERNEVEEDAPIQLARAEHRLVLIQKELEIRKLEFEMKQLEVQAELLSLKAKHDMRKEILPMEQMPQVAESVSQIFNGANLSIYGDSSAPLVSTVSPLVDMLVNAVKQAGFGGSAKPESN